MRGRFVRSIAVILILSFCVNTNVMADDDLLQNQLDKNNQQLEDLQNKKDDVTNEISKEEATLKEVEAKIESKSEDLQKVQKEVDAYEVEINLLQEEINGIQTKIVAVEEEITEREEVINKLLEEQSVKEKLLTDRIRNYYKLDVSRQFIYIILKSENIYEAFNNVNYIWGLINLDKELIDEAKQKEEKVKSEKENLKVTLEEQLERETIVFQKQDKLVSSQKKFIAQKELQENMLHQLQTLEREKSEIIIALKQQGNYLDNQIGDLIAYNKELQQQLDDLFNDLNNDSDNNKPPVSVELEFLRPSNGVITDTFGPRINPVTGQPGKHTGIDYAADFDTPILASKSGIIEYVGWINGYGNTIIINHGDDIKTLYAHCNSLVGVLGQTVSQGELVAYVGSTGMSTGPHLHFEIRIKGNPVDPYIYIPY